MEQFHLEIQNLYAALAQPTEKLTVSYPVSDGKGAEKRPSFVIGRIARLLPSISVETESTDKEYRLSVKSTALEYAGEHIGGALWQYFEGQGDAERALAAMKDASRYTRGHLSRDAVRALYGGAVTLSASRMDMARSCHFAYFMRYGLKARERTGAGFDAPQIGTFVHDVMEHTLRQADCIRYRRTSCTRSCARRSRNTSTACCRTCAKKARASVICSTACARRSSASWTR